MTVLVIIVILAFCYLIGLFFSSEEAKHNPVSAEGCKSVLRGVGCVFFIIIAIIAYIINKS